MWRSWVGELCLAMNPSETQILPFHFAQRAQIECLTGNHIVVEPHWRSPVLTHLLHSLDTLYPIVKNAVGYNQRGQLPHLRIRDHSRQTEGDDFPRGLPLAAYDNEWLMEEPDKASYQVFPNRDVNLRLQELDDAVRRCVHF